MEEKEGIGGGYIVLIILGLLVIVVAIAGLWYLDRQAAPEREAYTALAQCLSEQDVIFYGAFWCPNCAAQKALFKDAGKDLPHIECSLPNRAQNELCESREVANYPTWEFNGNKRCVGVLSPEVLAHLSGCPLPAYGETDYTVKSLYKQLILEQMTKNLKKRGYSAEDVGEFIEKTSNDIEAYLTEHYQTTLEGTENVDHFLAAMAEVVNECEPYEKEGDAAEAEATAE